MNLKFIIMTMLLTSCAGVKVVKKKDLTPEFKELLNKNVFIPLQVATFATNKNKYELDGKEITLNKNSEINFCKKAKVIEFFKQGMGNHLRVLVFQDMKYFALGGRDFRLKSYDLYTKMPLKNRRIKIKNINEMSHKLLCKGQLWLGMSENELIFLLGKPDKINTTNSMGSITKQYVYRGYQKSKYYYFKDLVLTSWQI